MPEISPRKLATDFTMVLHDAQEILRTTAGQAIQHIGDLRERRRCCENEEDAPALTEFTAELAQETWAKVALAAGIGLLVGLLIRRIVKRIG